VLIDIQYEGEVTIRAPPTSEAFDPVKRQASLILSRTNPTSQASGHGTSDIAHLSTILKVVMDASCPPQAETPKTPAQTHSAGLSFSSPPKPTPSKLRHFLVYAKKNLGVLDATGYEYRLEAPSCA
jgi:hypothetical protein